MVRAIHRRAPTRLRIRLLGTSNRQIPDEEQPGPETEDGIAEREVSLQPAAAKPMLTRSRYAMT